MGEWNSVSYYNHEGCYRWTASSGKDPAKYFGSREWRKRKDQVIRRAGALCERCFYPRMWPPDVDRREEGLILHPDDRMERGQELKDAIHMGTGGHLFAPALTVHHLTYEHFGNESLEELVALCGWCHRRANVERRREERAELKRLGKTVGDLRREWHEKYYPEAADAAKA